jgi:hypothetical protein
MTALLCQILEPPGNLIRVGNTEGASQLQRKVAADVKFMNPSGTLNHIAANTPAIPWTSSTGFGPSDGPPTTAATVDLTTFAGRWVTFILAGAGGSTQPMYVCQVTDWQAVAGPAGGRTVIPLDLWELHSWRYCGPEFTGDMALRQSGTYAFTTTDIPANRDYSNVKTLAYATAYGAGLVPDVDATSQDKEWFATATPTPGQVTTHIDVQLTRNWPLDDRRQTSFATATVLDTKAVSGSPAGTATSVTYLTAFQSAPSLAVRVETVSGGVPTGIGAADYIVVVQSQSASGFTFLLYYRPAQGTPADTDYAPTGLSDTTTTMLGILGAPVKAEATTDSTAIGDPGSTLGVTDPGSGVFTGDQTTNHAHVIPQDDYTATPPAGGFKTGNQDTPHQHGLSLPGSNHFHGVGPHGHIIDDHHHAVVEPHSGDGHRHALLAAVVSGDQTRAVVWTAIGPLTAPAATVKASWMASG